MSSHSTKSDIKILSAEDVGHDLTEYKFTIQVKAATYEKIPYEQVEGDLMCGILDAIKDNLGTMAADIRFVPITQ